MSIGEKKNSSGNQNQFSSYHISLYLYQLNSCRVNSLVQRWVWPRHLSEILGRTLGMLEKLFKWNTIILSQKQTLSHDKTKSHMIRMYILFEIKDFISRPI